MDRRIKIASWVVVVAVGSLMGLAIAGLPELSARPAPPSLGDTAAEVNDPGGASDPDDSAPSTETPTSISSAPEPTDPDPDPATVEAPVATDEAPPLRPNDQVTVLVANATDVIGAAGRLTDRLAADGHPMAPPLTTFGFAVSEVWFVDGFGPEASALAERIGVFPENVQLVPDAPQFPVGNAAVVVVMGPDLAGA